MATERDVIEVAAREKRLCELIDGVLVEKAMGFYESRLAVVLIYFLERFLEQHPLGCVVGEAGMMRLAEGMVRIPDVSFISWDRLPDRESPKTPIPDLVPDLAVEVLSGSNTESEMARKLEEYFGTGVRVVWYVEPGARAVRIYSAPQEMVRIGADQVLEGGDVLPGFALPLAEWFARAEGPKNP
jgi:Uma2 family endonuclease